MKLLTTTHRDIFYEFRYLEQSKVVEITKGDRFTYLMIGKSNSLFLCNCPGSTYHGKCWHRSMIHTLMKMDSVNEPWAEWAEEAGKEQYVRL